jgi:hypothetical protein
MDLKQASAWRDRAGKIGTVFCVLLFLAILDALMARFRELPNHFSGLPGGEISVTGPLADQTETLSDLTSKGSSEKITLRFEALQKGYWLGGAMWNGILKIDSTAAPGTYTVRVQNRKGTNKNEGPLFYIKVFKNLADLQKNSPSFFISLLGIIPWRAALFFFPWVVLAFGMVFYLSGQRDRLLSLEGKAEVYRVRAVEGEVEISFALAGDQGIQPGMPLSLYNPEGIEIGSIVVFEVFGGHSTSRVDQSWKVLPGFIVSR